MKKNFMLIVALAAILFFAAPMTTEAAEGEGSWKQNATGWWYEFSDGSYLTDGMFEIDGEWYYFDAAGYMKTGWVLVEYDFGGEGDEPIDEPIPAEWYYFKSNGAMAKGWLQDGADWYYLDPEAGYMWAERPVGDYYYVGADGKMVTNDYIEWGETLVAFGPDGRVIEKGWFHIVDEMIMGWIYFEDAGVMAEGWVSDGGNWYYLDNGLMAIGTYIMDYQGVPHLYKFATDGRMVVDKVATAGWIEADGCWYYYDGADLYRDGWYQIGGEWYVFNYLGMMRFSTVAWDGDYAYLLGTDGAMVRNEWVLLREGPETAWAYADANGVAYEDEWLQLGSTWYYFDGIAMVETPCYIDGKLELFAASGAWLGTSNVTTGWVAAPWDSWYYVENSKLATGWRFIGGAWYYFDEYDYTAYVGDYYNIDDEEYLFDKNGALASGWVQDMWGDWLYGDAEGHPYCNQWLQLGSSWYYFDGYYMLENGIYEVDDEYYLFGASGLWLGSAYAYADGWHYLDNDWYYVEDGEFVNGLQKIDGKIYGFMNGMITDSIAPVYTFSANRLGIPVYIVGFDANGNMLKNQWLYLKEDGVDAWIWFDGQGYGQFPTEYFAMML